MTKNIYRLKGNFKGFLFVAAILIILGTLYFSQALVKDLQDHSHEFLQFKAKIIEEYINSEESGDLSFFFTNVIQTADYPIIYTDVDKNPVFWKNVGLPENDGAPVDPETDTKLRKMVAEFAETNPPIPISFQDNVFGYYCYGESPTIRNLKWLPFIEIFVVALFILIGYAGFHSIKKGEERLIWVGMAKETAHQLGTPLSSQIGWLEYLKSSPGQLDSVIPELQKDINRLQRVTNRFSQIGSLPDMKPENLNDIIADTVQYFRNRIPKKNGKTQINMTLPAEMTTIVVNKDLFSWVLENLIKNGLDAMENKGGNILISGEKNGEHVYIDVKDTGKGIGGSAKKDIFKPGYSTKKRGWGLGLSLAKRIVEEYHGGKLFLKESHVGEGATFRIVLNSV